MLFDEELSRIPFSAYLVIVIPSIDQSISITPRCIYIVDSPRRSEIPWCNRKALWRSERTLFVCYKCSHYNLQKKFGYHKNKSLDSRLVLLKSTKLMMSQYDSNQQFKKSSNSYYNLTVFAVNWRKIDRGCSKLTG